MKTPTRGSWLELARSSNTDFRRAYCRSGRNMVISFSYFSFSNRLGNIIYTPLWLDSVLAELKVANNGHLNTNEHLDGILWLQWTDVFGLFQSE